MVSPPSASRRWNTKFRTRSAAVSGVPRALRVSKISWEFSDASSSMDTSCRPVEKDAP